MKMSTVKLASKPTIRPSHRKAAEGFLDALEGPFRRSGLSAVLYPLTTPRSLSVADRLADGLMRDWATAGRIQKHGHQHWAKVLHERKLRSGRAVPELAESLTLDLITRCPDKWVSIDLETGDVWAGSSKGWKRSTATQRQEAIAALSSKP